MNKNGQFLKIPFGNPFVVEMDRETISVNGFIKDQGPRMLCIHYRIGEKEGKMNLARPVPPLAGFRRVVPQPDIS